MINGDKLLDYIGALNMCDEISNEAYKKIMTHCEEQEPCEDCISRAWLKEAIHNFFYGLKHSPTEEDIQAYIDVAPPVTPQPEIGEWLEKEVNSDKIEEWQSARCSICDRYHTTPYMYYFSKYNYCPNCGARMEVSE